MEDKHKFGHKQNNHDKSAHSSFGRSIMRFSIFFVSLCAFVPFFTLMRESQRKGSYGSSIWWLKPASKEDLSWTLEEDVNTGDQGKKLSRWAQQQKSIASLYSINFARGAFCRNNLAPNAHRQQQYSESSSEPLIWDASIGDRGSIINVIVSPRKQYIDSLDSTRSSSGSYPSLSTLPAMRRATCRLYDHRSQLLATVTSLVVLGGSLVRCPIPHEFRKHAQGQEIRMGIKLVWPDLADVIRKSQTVKSSGSGVGSGILGAFIKSSTAAEEIKVGSVVIVPKGAVHTNRSLLFELPQDGVVPSGGRPLYPVCPLPVTAIMSDSREFRKSMMGRETGLGGGGGRTRGAVPYIDREEERERDWGWGTEFQVQGLRGRPAVPPGTRSEVSSASGNYVISVIAFLV
jgi:hypothetical protein